MPSECTKSYVYIYDVYAKLGVIITIISEIIWQSKIKATERREKKRENNKNKKPKKAHTEAKRK